MSAADDWLLQQSQTPALPKTTATPMLGEGVSADDWLLQQSQTPALPQATQAAAVPTEKETMLSRVLAARDLSEVGRRAGRGLWKGAEGLADVAEFAVQAGSPTSRVGDPTARDVGMGAFYQENLAKYLEPRIPPGEAPLTQAAGTAVEIGAEMFSPTKTGLRAALGAGVGGAAGEAVGDETGKFWGALGGGLYQIPLGLYTYPKGVISRWFSDPTPGKPGSKMFKGVHEQIRKHATGNHQTALANASRAISEGQGGTLGTITRDPGILAYEKKIEVEDPARYNEFNQVLHDEFKNAGRQAAESTALTGVGRRVGTVNRRHVLDAEKVLDQLEQAGTMGTGQMLSGITHDARQAVDNAAETMAPLRSTIFTTDASKDLYDSVLTRRKNHKQYVDTLWDAVPANVTFDATQVVGDLERVINKLDPAQREFFMQNFGSKYDVIKRTMLEQGQVPARQVASARTLFRELGDLGMVSGTTAMKGNRTTMRNLSDSLVRTMNSHPDVSPAYTLARQKSYEHHDLWTDNNLGRQIAKEDPNIFGVNTITSGDIGATNIDELMAVSASSLTLQKEGTEVTDAIDGYLKSRFERETRNSAGEFNADKASSGLTDFREVYARRPDLLSQFEAGVMAEKNAASSSAYAKSTAERLAKKESPEKIRRTQEQSALMKSRAAIMAAQERPLDEVFKRLSGDSPKRDIRNLISVANRSDDPGGARDDLASAVMLSILENRNKVFKAEDEGRAYLNIRDAVKDTAVLTGAQIQRLDRLQEIADVTKTREALKGVNLDEKSPGWKATLGVAMSGMGYVVAPSVGPFLAGTLRRMGRGGVKEPDARLKKVMADILAHPEKHTKLLDELAEFNDAQTIGQKVMNYADRTARPGRLYAAATESKFADVSDKPLRAGSPEHNEQQLARQEAQRKSLVKTLQAQRAKERETLTKQILQD